MAGQRKHEIQAKWLASKKMKQSKLESAGAFGEFGKTLSLFSK
jgi:hypothetical protein